MAIFPQITKKQGQAGYDEQVRASLNSLSLLEESGLVWKGSFTPTAPQEYPATPVFGEAYTITLTAGYTFTAGDLIGQTVSNGMILAYDTGWLISSLDAYSKADFDALLGVADGIATLDSGGKVPASQLPSYVDDVVEYADFASLPATGETGKIYITLDNNFMYRWSGSVYIDITSKVDSVAGKTGTVVLDGDDISFDNTASGLGATTSQGAIDEIVDTMTDVFEFADLGSFPATGKTAKIYIAIDTKYTYKWNGSAYVLIGAVTSVAGKRGIVTLDGDDVSFDPSGNTLTATKTQSAIEELTARTDGLGTDVTANRASVVANGLTTADALEQATAPEIGSMPFLYTGQIATNVGDGVELVTNGTFDTDTTGWTTVNATLTVNNGVLTIDDISPYGIAMTQDVTTVISQEYLFSIDILGGSWTNYIVAIDGVQIGTSLGNTVATKNFYFTATSTSSTIAISTGSGVSRGTLICDNISVQEVIPATALLPDGTGFIDNGDSTWTLGLGSMQVANDNGDGVTLAIDWTDTTHALDDVVFDNSITGNGKAFKCIVAVTVATGTSPLQDATNWEEKVDQYGGRFNFKNRSIVSDHQMYDSIRGDSLFIETDTTAIEASIATGLTNIDPFILTVGSNASHNGSGNNIVVWVDQTIRKTAGVRDPDGNIINAMDIWVSTGVYEDLGGGTSYDVATHASLCELDSSGNPVIVHYNPTTKFFIALDKGDGVAGRDIPTMGINPDVLFRKNLIGAVQNWAVYDSYNGADKTMYLNLTNLSGAVTFWNNTEPTNDKFTVGSNASINASTVYYINYGQANSENHLIKIYQGTGVVGNEIDSEGLDMSVAGACIWVKSTTQNYGWITFDNLRVSGDLDGYLYLDASTAEVIGTDYVSSNKTNITINGLANALSNSGQTYLIMMYSPVYNKPTGGKEIQFNSTIGLVSADGKNANNALQTKEATLVSLANLDIGTGNEGTTQYVFLDDIGTKTNSSQKMNVGKNRIDADKWGVTNGAYKTTDRHGGYESASGVVSASSFYTTLYEPYQALNQRDTSTTNQYGWTALSGEMPSWWRYSLPEKRKLVNLRMKTGGETGKADSLPKDFLVEGSNDGGVTWTTVLTVSGQVVTTVRTWGDVHTVTSQGNYFDYRIYITANNGDTFNAIAELDLNFEISDAPYLNTQDNIVYDSSDVATDLVAVGEAKVDGQGGVYDVVNYEPNKVYINGAVFTDVVFMDENTVLLTNSNSILPDLVALGKRYILANPFGKNVPVELITEILYNNVWTYTGFIYASGGYGVIASYVEGVGIVVQVGGTQILGTSANSGGGHGSTGNSSGSHPCRVRATRIGGK